MSAENYEKTEDKSAQETLEDIEWLRVNLNTLREHVLGGRLTADQQKAIRTAIAGVYEVTHDKALEL